MTAGAARATSTGPGRPSCGQADDRFRNEDQGVPGDSVALELPMEMRFVAVAVAFGMSLAGSPLLAQPQDYEIHGGYRVGGFQVGVRAARMVAALGREEVSGPWTTSWGRVRVTQLRWEICSRSGREIHRWGGSETRSSGGHPARRTCTRAGLPTARESS